MAKAKWPNERQILMRPDRLDYVRGQRSEACVFCEAAKVKTKSFETLVLWRSSKQIVILNKYPYNTGHLLVLPRKHLGELTKLSNDDFQKLSLVVKHCAEILLEAYQCPGLNIGLNHGSAAGAGIPDHLHWHLIPRWKGDTNFFPLIANTKVLPETLEQSYYKLKPRFDNLEL